MISRERELGELECFYYDGCAQCAMFYYDLIFLKKFNNNNNIYNTLVSGFARPNDLEFRMVFRPRELGLRSNPSYFLKNY